MAAGMTREAHKGVAPPGSTVGPPMFNEASFSMDCECDGCQIDVMVSVVG